MLTREQVQISRKLSLILRHKPEVWELTLDAEGYVKISDLLKAAEKQRVKLTRETLREIVEQNDKKRFVWVTSPHGLNDKIRAAQGHSVPVRLGLPSSVPPSVLYHGTTQQAWESIKREGILREKRQQVHLSADVETALSVGRRHGIPLILAIDTAKVRELGGDFFLAENGVWLIDMVPPQALSVAREGFEKRKDG